MSSRAFRRAWGLDMDVVAKFVDTWRDPVKVGRGPFKEAVPETPIQINDIAWELGIGQAKAAITMKYAAKEGWVRCTNKGTGEQLAYEPTQKALDAFPAGEAHVMPEVEEEIRPGIVLRGVPGGQAKWMRDQEGWRRVEPPRRQHGLPEGKERFKGYLPPGDDAA